MSNLTEEIIEQGLSDRYFDVLATKSQWPDLYPLFSNMYFLCLELMDLRLHVRNLFHHHRTQVRQIKNLSKTLMFRKFGMIFCTFSLRMMAPESLQTWMSADAETMIEFAGPLSVSLMSTEIIFQVFSINLICAVIFVGCFAWEQTQLPIPWTSGRHKNKSNLEIWIKVLLSSYLDLPPSKESLAVHPLPEFQKLHKDIKERLLSTPSKKTRALALNRFEVCAKNLQIGDIQALESYRDKLPFIELLSFVTCLGVFFGDMVQ